ncbi:MAG TPA: glycosyltransferase family 2 protein [Polyangia bacterium]
MTSANSTGKSAAAGATSLAPTGSRISVAMCTFNGARFLEPQLDSFPAQTRRPDELVVCDDGSTDDTLAIVERFAQRAPFPVRIVRNECRLGSTKNFEKAIGLCTGDLIATCDQDDVWLPDKLALSEAAINATPTRGLVFTNAEVVDDELRSLGHTMWDAIHFDSLARRRVRRGRPFEVLLRQWVVTGATMMFRAAYRPFVLPIPDKWVHDGWIAFIIGALVPIGFVERPTLKYRQHAAQQIGGKKLGLRELYKKAREVGPAHFRLDYERFQLARERLRSLPSQVQNAKILAKVDGKVEHQHRRLVIAEASSRWQRVLWTLDELLHWGYHRYSPATTHCLKDLLF